MHYWRPEMFTPTVPYPFMKPRRANVPTNPPNKAIRSCTIHATPPEIYQYWRNLENLPRIMPDLESVKELSAIISDSLPLEKAAEAYEKFSQHKAIKVVLKPGLQQDRRRRMESAQIGVTMPRSKRRYAER